ncbi:MAG: cupredoxin domain-containing protein [Chloroflexi bacterium]|nr:cupredoxin domain-containing protein [Chloroflexota bacterium]
MRIRNPRRVAALALGAATLAIAAGGGMGDPTSARGVEIVSTAMISAASANNQAAQPWLVTMSRDRFHSDFTIINVGDTVMFRNDAEDPTNGHDVQAVDGSFASPYIRPGESWSFTFNTEGYYAYYCSFHEGMEGAILVVYPE